MAIRDYFKPVPTKTVAEVREFLKINKRSDYNLIDVRQPEEYKKGNIAGANLIPVKDLTYHLDDIDKDKPTIVYCRSGNRSNSAAGLLIGLGFKDVYNMAGGILAWEGAEMDGGPMAGSLSFPPDAAFADIAALAWTMEDGTGRYYAQLADWMAEPGIVGLYEQLVTDEENHRESIALSYSEITGEDIKEKVKKIADEEKESYMEGGMKVDEALEWSEGRSIVALLSFSMSMEINSYDLYRKIAERAEGESSRDLFKQLADDEWSHLARMSAQLDKHV